MTDNVLHIKQEIDSSSTSVATLSSCYSPTTTTTINNASSSNVYVNGGNAGNNNSNSSSVGGHTGSSASRASSSGGGGTASGGGGIKSSPSVSPERQMCSSTTTLSLNSDGSYSTHGNSVSGSGNNGGSGGAGAGGGGNSIRDELRRLCLVCGDVASGFHYGVASCEACKAFFKRTIQGNIEYTCPANNECEINKRRRKACQACRFQKCLLMGMLKEGVRLDRVRGGRQKYRRNPVSNSYQTMQLLYQSSITSLGDVKILDVLNNYEPDALCVQPQTQTQSQTQPQPQSQAISTPTSSANNVDDVPASVASSSSPSIKHEHSNLIAAGSLSCNSLGSTTEPPTTPPTTPSSSSTTSNSTTACIFQTNNNSDAHDILCVLGDLYDKELVNVIGWAKQIPGFTELPLNDQMKLLQVSWAEILTLQLTFRSLPFNGKLCFATDVWMDELLAKECGYTEFYYHCVQVAQRLERISPRREEYYLLKALLLANCDILLDDQSSLRSFRDTILNSLNDVVYLLRHSAAVSHQQQLLLLLPSLRQADDILRRFWREISRERSLPLKKLFMEMLEPVTR